MNDFFDGFAKLADVVFNGRNAQGDDTRQDPKTVTVAELVNRGDSTIKYRGELYSVSVKKLVLK